MSYSTRYDARDYERFARLDRSEEEIEEEERRVEAEIDAALDLEGRRQADAAPSPVGADHSTDQQTVTRRYHITSFGAMYVDECLEELKRITADIQRRPLAEWPKVLVDLVDVKERLFRVSTECIQEEL